MRSIFTSTALIALIGSLIIPLNAPALIGSNASGEYFACMMFGFANRFDGKIRLFFNDGTDKDFDFKTRPGYVYNLVFSRDWGGIFRTEIEARGVSYGHNADYSSRWIPDGSTSISDRESSRAINMTLANVNFLLSLDIGDSIRGYVGIGGGQARVTLDSKMGGIVGCSQSIYGASINISNGIMIDIRSRNVATEAIAHLTLFNSPTTDNSNNSNKLQQILQKLLPSGSTSIQSNQSTAPSNVASDAYISGLGGASIEIGMRFVV